MRSSAAAPRRRFALLAALVVLALVPAIARGAEPVTEVRDGDVVATIAADRVTLANDAVQRSWTTAPFESRMLDRRTGLALGPSPDFRLVLADGVELTGAEFEATSVRATRAPRGGVAVTFELDLAGAPAGRVTRTVTAFPGIAGFEVRTTVAVAGALVGYTPDELVLPGAAPTAHAFNAGYDWRGSDTPDWEPTVAPFGGAHTGDHRVTTSAPAGGSVEGEGQWLSAARADGARAFSVIQRVNLPSTRAAWDGSQGGTRVDLAHDVASLGPFEADVHLANPTPAPLRQRVVSPAKPLALETVFTGLARDADDEPWQHHRYLVEQRMPAWQRAVVFNSNGVDDDRISTGAKDDMDLAEVRRQAAIAQRLGVEVFILDDGWQAASGDWCPDSPQCREPRGLYPDRFPDAEFRAVREAIGDMQLGLWMSPMHFNPAAAAFRENPQWSCHPVGTALAGYNTVEPNSSSNEAGLGTWNPEAIGPDGKLIDHIESAVRRAITQWGVTYFKFDFLAWLDCAGADTVTMYDYRESFVRMLDRVLADHPTVTLQIDETNDYRLFPFESIARGPSWYANGNPSVDQALHNLWVLGPYVPMSTLGQSAYGDRNKRPLDYVLAASLLSHVTFFNDLREYSEEQIAVAARWTAVYREHRDRFSGFVYPLLSDPLGGKNWTALQPWDVDRQRGALLVFRQDTADDRTRVALRGVRGDGLYRISDALDRRTIAVVSADELRAGIDVSVPQRHSAAVWLIDPVADARQG